MREQRAVRIMRALRLAREAPIVVRGEYECVYNNVPLRGLARVAGHVDAVGKAATASGRLGRNDDGADAPITAEGNERAV